ncbi:MAG: hypothetical protein QG629_902 [Patescibacteria group bacterium]|nr:hypothetical protein [Candidatus Saccharibacteria bacterium]MDQ5963819.1 hypothetical protein [Patescibacteria group bacterium]
MELSADQTHIEFTAEECDLAGAQPSLCLEDATSLADEIGKSLRDRARSNEWSPTMFRLSYFNLELVSLLGAIGSGHAGGSQR